MRFETIPVWILGLCVTVDDMKLSVVIPVFNAAPYLEESLGSILGQSFRDFEVIAVNDGSGDNSLSILNTLATRDVRLKVVDQQRRGAGASRNRGLDLAQGEYLYFMDADDKLDADAFARMISVAEESLLDMLIFAAAPFAADETSAELARKLKEYADYYRIDPRLCWQVRSGPKLMWQLMRHGQLTASSPLRLLNTQFVRTVGVRFPEGVIREDESFAMPLLFKARRVMAISDKIYFRRLRPDSVMAASSSKHHVEGLLVAANTLKRMGFTRDKSWLVRLLAWHLRDNYVAKIGREISIVRRLLWKVLGL